MAAHPSLAFVDVAAKGLSSATSQGMREGRQVNGFCRKETMGQSKESTASTRQILEEKSTRTRFAKSGHSIEQTPRSLANRSFRGANDVCAVASCRGRHDCGPYVKYRQLDTVSVSAVL